MYWHSHGYPPPDWSLVADEFGFLWRRLVWKLFPARRPVYIALLGGPGAGKGTVATALAPALGLNHISTGALIRREIASGSEFGKKVQERVSRGQLIDDEMVFELLQNALRDKANARGAILDGFPRSQKQAQMLDALLAGWGQSLHRAVWLELTSDDLVERLSLRRTCTNNDCGRTYHLRFQPPAREGVCDACASPLYQRKDDAPEAIVERLRIYDEETRPMREHYQKGTALKVLNPNNTMSPEQVLADVVAAVQPLR